jgi:hypothetical protein
MPRTTVPTENQRPIVVIEAARPAVRWSLLIWALPIMGLGIFFFVVAAYWGLVMMELGFLANAPLDVPRLAFGRGLILWAATSVLMLAAFLWASVIGWRIWLETCDALPAEWRRPISVLQLGVYVFALGLGWLVNTRDGTGIDDYIHAALQALMGFGSIQQLLLQTDRLGLITMRSSLEVAFALNGAASAGGVVALAFGAATLGLKSRTADAETLYLLFQRFQLMIWSAGVFLVLLVLQLHALVSWPEQVARALTGPVGSIPDLPRLTGALGQLANSAAAGAGLLFSGFAAVIFLPVGVLQQRRLQELIEAEIRADPKFDRDPWLKRYGFADTTPFAFFLKTGGVLAPLATGLLTQLLGSVPK